MTALCQLDNNGYSGTLRERDWMSDHALNGILRFLLCRLYIHQQPFTRTSGWHSANVKMTPAWSPHCCTDINHQFKSGGQTCSHIKCLQLNLKYDYSSNFMLTNTIHFNSHRNVQQIERAAFNNPRVRTFGSPEQNHRSGTYISRVWQQVLLKRAGLPNEPFLRSDPVSQVAHDDSVGPLMQSTGQ